MSRRRRLPLIEELVISEIGAEGKAIGKFNDFVVFVPYAVPGDIVDVQVTRKKKNFYEGKAIKFHTYSKLRTEAFCDHFGVCGGCKWQMLPYEEQLKSKQKIIVDHLTRIGKIELPKISDIIPSKTTQFYRNKLEYTFSNKRYLTVDEIDSQEGLEMNALGFHVPKLFDKVLDINKCYLQEEPSNAIRNTIREYALKNDLEFFNIRTHEGFLRNLIIRLTSINELMVIVAFYKENKEKREALLNYVYKKFPAINSLMYVINSKANDTIADQNIILYKGEGHIYEEMEGLKFKIGPKSFYQTNSEQAYELYKVTRDFADLTGNEVVYDLYTGTGTIANFVAKKSKKVIGLEFVEDAIKDAKVNSKANNISNTDFFAGDIKDILTDEFIDSHGRPEVIITDPPRAGMHKNVILSIIYARPKKIVYVSCNSATQARDIELLDDLYKVTKVQPVDMFPHTHHVENVVLLEQR